MKLTTMCLSCRSRCPPNKRSVVSIHMNVLSNPLLCLHICGGCPPKNNIISHLLTISLMLTFQKKKENSYFFNYFSTLQSNVAFEFVHLCSCRQMSSPLFWSLIIKLVKYLILDCRGDIMLIIGWSWPPMNFNGWLAHLGCFNYSLLKRH